MIDTKLKNKTVLITGANSGIGKSTARAFAAEGANVVIHFLEKPPFIEEPFKQEFFVPGRAKAEELEHEIKDNGGRAIIVEGDLSSPDIITQIFDQAEKALKKVDVLVNNAAHCELPDTIFEVTPENFNRHFQVNTRATVLLSAEYIKRFKEHNNKWGRIINLSTASSQDFPGQISYGASKAAIEAYTRSIAREVGHLGITVNTVSPGAVQTGWIKPDLEELLLKHIPLGRIGKPEDIGDVIVFLASDQARWLTGQVIKVTGGYPL